MGLAITNRHSSRPAVVRFWERVQKGDGGWACWEWLGGKDRFGYGLFEIAGTRAEREKQGRRTAMAHRFAYETLVGPIPDGLTLDHLCRNTSCVNPEHLEPVTEQENLARSWEVRRMVKR